MKSQSDGRFAALVVPLVEIVRTGQVDERLRALKILTAIGPDAALAVPHLIETLRGTEPLRESAVQALAAIGPAAAPAIPVLVRIMLHGPGAPDWAHLYVPATLAATGSQRVVMPLIEAAERRDDPDLSSAAMYALGRLGPLAAPAIPVLMNCLKDSKLARHDALKAVGRIGVPAAGVLPDLRRLYRASRSGSWDQWHILSAIAKIAPASRRTISDVIHFLRARPTGELRHFAAELLMNIVGARKQSGLRKDRGIVSLYVALLSDRHIGVQQAAWIYFASNPDARALPILIKQLCSRNRDTRQGAATVLGLMGLATPEVLEALNRSRRDADTAVRECAVRAFSIVTAQ